MPDLCATRRNRRPVPPRPTAGRIEVLPPPAARASNRGARSDARSRDAHVVGTYASGGNTYVMYSDGSIEAETPRGRFTFESLDELKAFVEAAAKARRAAPPDRRRRASSSALTPAG